MAYQDITTLYGNPWGDKVAALDSGHFALFYPGSGNVADKDKNQLVLYDPNGQELARCAGALRGFDLIVAGDGEVVAIVARYTDNGIPMSRWHTGVRVAVSQPPASGGNNAALVAAIKAKLVEVTALLNQIQ